MAADEPTPRLPAKLATLFADRSAGRALSLALPAGRLVWPDPADMGAEHDAPTRPAYWLSDAPAPAALWSRLRIEHTRSGLWPLLLAGMDSDPKRPWVVGEVTPEPVDDIDSHDAASFLAQVWVSSVKLQEDHAPDLDFAYLAPFRCAWPGLAAPGELREDPVVVADQYAESLVDGRARLGLVAVDRSADALAVTGWDGPGNFWQTTSPLAAVVRSWEDRFGVRVVRVGFDTLDLSVAGPPVTPEHALHVAAEHFAFCPDSIELDAGALAVYAEKIRGKNSWSFWWD